MSLKSCITCNICLYENRIYIGITLLLHYYTLQLAMMHRIVYVGYLALS